MKPQKAMAFLTDEPTMSMKSPPSRVATTEVTMVTTPNVKSMTLAADQRAHTQLACRATSHACSLLSEDTLRNIMGLQVSNGAINRCLQLCLRHLVYQLLPIESHNAAWDSQERRIMKAHLGSPEGVCPKSPLYGAVCYQVSDEHWALPRDDDVPPKRPQPALPTQQYASMICIIPY